MPNRMDAISFLRADHDKVRGLLAQLEQTTDRGSRRKELLTQIADEVSIHATLEEEIFYPSYRDAAKNKEDKQLYQEALEEHHVVDLVLPEIEEIDPSSEVFAAKAKVLKDIIEHHAQEEEKLMFTKAREILKAAELQELGERMQARKAELQRSEEEEDELETEQEEEEEDID